MVIADLGAQMRTARLRADTLAADVEGEIARVGVLSCKVTLSQAGTSRRAAWQPGDDTRETRFARTGGPTSRTRWR